MEDSRRVEPGGLQRGRPRPLETILSAALLLATGAPLRSRVEKIFPGGFVVCVFDGPATLTNHGSKLVVQVQDSSTHRWSGLPVRGNPASKRWSRAFVEADSSTDELHDGGVLTIKPPVTVGFCNFKGGKIDVEFPVESRQIKR